SHRCLKLHGVTAPASRSPGDGRHVSTVVVAHCRAGFEGECAADLRRLALSAGVPIKIDETSRRAFIAAGVDSFDTPRWQRAILHCPPIFARSIFAGSGPHPL